ncbi:helix-hairpin-helix domain-containing protein [Hamadaea tsunoensis]|uniref:helix-hairpin-helix domain-containing protein n=1 Tax=Hamadaea tsunoensis TaxID=53368 RepID=UPI0004031E6E
MRSSKDVPDGRAAERLAALFPPAPIELPDPDWIRDPVLAADPGAGWGSGTLPAEEDWPDDETGADSVPSEWPDPSAWPEPSGGPEPSGWSESSVSSGSVSPEFSASPGSSSRPGSAARPDDRAAAMDRLAAWGLLTGEAVEQRPAAADDRDLGRWRRRVADLPGELVVDQPGALFTEAVAAPPAGPPFAGAPPAGLPLAGPPPVGLPSTGSSPAGSPPVGSPTAGSRPVGPPRRPHGTWPDRRRRDRPSGPTWSDEPTDPFRPAWADEVTDPSLRTPGAHRRDGRGHDDPGRGDQPPDPPAKSALPTAAAFDPGRPGLKVIAVVAAVVVVGAAGFAWFTRPHEEPVAPAPALSAETSTASADPGGQVVVAVGGKVARPGLVRLPAGSRVADAVAAAGGALPGTDLSTVNLARKVVDGELITIGGPAGGGAAGGVPGKVSLNSATVAQLDALPGVGPVLAQRIVEYRDRKGGFGSVTELRQVDGIGDAKYAEIKDLVIL